jgi:hypothetical protein
VHHRPDLASVVGSPLSEKMNASYYVAAPAIL